MHERREHLIALSILAIVPTLMFADVLFGTSVLYLRDITTFQHPAKSLLRHIVLSGEFPYWNPWYSAGQPMAANPNYGTFYPPTWLVLLPDFEFGFNLLAVLHIHVACFTMYALLRSMHIGRPAAVFGGLSFGLGGMTMSLLNLWPCLFSIAWLPLTALHTRRFLRTRSPRALASASGFLGLQLLLGEPVTSLLTGIILGFYAIASGWRDGGARQAFRRTGFVALISVLALCVSAVQTLPVIDHVRDSVRSRGLEWDTVREWSMPPLRTGEFFFPHLLGFSAPDSGQPFWGGPLYGRRPTAFVLSLYGGLAVAALSLAGVFGRLRGAGLFGAISLCSLLLAFGEHTPLLRFLYDAGIAKSWRFPEKFVMMIGFASVVFAAVVLDRLLEGDARLRRIAVRVAAVITGVAVLMAVLSHLPLHRSLFALLFQIPGTPSDRILATSARLWLIEIARGLLLFVVFRNLGRVRQRTWLGLLGLFMILDLGPIIPEIAPRLDRSFYDAPPIASRFGPDIETTRLLPYAQQEDQERKSSTYLRGHEDLFWVVRNSLTPMVPADLRIRMVLELDFDLTALLPTTDFTSSMLELHERQSSDWLNIALSMSNGGYITVNEKPGIAFARAGGNLRHLQPAKVIQGVAYPRYYFASTLVPVRDRREFVELLLRNRYPRDVAFVPGPAFTPARGVVHWWRETANTALLDVEAAGRAFLVMSVTPHKYWTVAIDGIETESIITNIGYQGIIVPAGRHTVTMRYRNPLIAAGAAISLATLLVLALVARRSAPATMRSL